MYSGVIGGAIIMLFALLILRAHAAALRHAAAIAQGPIPWMPAISDAH